MKAKFNDPMTTICVICVVIFIAALASPAVAADEDVWGDKQGKCQMTEEKVEHILRRIAEDNPEHAEHLRRLSEENPQEFEEQMRQIIGQHFAQQGEGRGDGPDDGRQRPNRRQGKNRGRRGKQGQPGMMGTQGGMPGMMMPGMGMQGGRQGGGYRERMMKKHDKYVEWFKVEFPQEAEKLESLRQKHPEKYMKQMQTCQKKYGPIMMAQKKNPQLAEVLKEDLQLQSQRDILLKEYRSADKKQRKSLKKELKEVVNSRFDIVVKKKQLRYEQMLARLKELEEKVNAQQAEVENLKDKKGDAVEQRIEELVGETEKIDWN